MLGLAGEIDTAIAEAVKGLRGCGYSWAEIGTRLGITRQAAQQRWEHRPDTLTTADARPHPGTPAGRCLTARPALRSGYTPGFFGTRAHSRSFASPARRGKK